MDSLQARAELAHFFTRAEALDAGHTDRSIAAAIRNGEWVRVRPGAYAPRDQWAAADDLTRHRTECAAVLERLGGRVALSHTSAAVMHGIDLWAPDLSRVHVTRLDAGAGRFEAGVQHHEGLLLDDDVVPVAGGLAVQPARAAVEQASLVTQEAALVTFDSVLRDGLAESAEVARVVALLSSWPSTRHLQVPLRMMDGLSGSVGESRARYLCFAYGLPAPVLQFEVRHPSGALAGITDFAWPEHRLLGEFDGRVKYGRLLRPGEEPGDAVFREKVREDLLRELTDCRMFRLIWADLARPTVTADRIRHLLRVAA